MKKIIMPLEVGTRSKRDGEEGLHTKLEDKLDVMFDRYIKIRDNHTCIFTGNRRRFVYPTPFFGDSISLRWDERNWHCMAESEIIIFRQYDCVKYYDWMKNTYGEEVFMNMRTERKKPGMYYTVQQLLDMLEYYNERIQELAYE